MKIVNRSTFLSMPPGTVYAKGKDLCFGGMCIKGENRGTSDWWVFDPAGIEFDDTEQFVERMDDMRKNGASYPMDGSVVADGLYEDDALFLLFEDADIVRLIEMLQESLAVAQAGSAP